MECTRKDVFLSLLLARNDRDQTFPDQGMRLDHDGEYKRVWHMWCLLEQDNCLKRYDNVRTESIRET